MVIVCVLVEKGDTMDQTLWKLQKVGRRRQRWINRHMLLLLFLLGIYKVVTLFCILLQARSFLEL